MKKFIITLGFVSLMAGLLISGCSEKKELVKQKEQNTEVNIKKPQPNKINPEQAKHPLPKDSQPFTGKVVKVEGQKVIVDVKGATLEFEVTKDTNLQKGNKPLSGSLKDLKANVEINVLTQKGKALAVAY